MKKTLALLLALMMGLSLVACGSSTDSEVKEPAKVEVGGAEASENSANTEDGEATHRKTHSLICRDAI